MVLKREYSTLVEKSEFVVLVILIAFVFDLIDYSCLNAKIYMD